MTLYKRILVPLDGSKLAEAVLPYVRALAGPFDSSVILLSVFEVPILGSVPDDDRTELEALPHVSRDRYESLWQQAGDYLEQVAMALRDAGVQCETRVAFGPVAATIMNTAVSEDVGLIAMASHGTGGLRGVYYGSVAAGVLQRVDRPLLIVRAQDENQD